MKTKRRKLTKDQKERGVIFSSTFKNTGDEEITHEVFEDDEKADEKIERLKDTSFFEGWGADENGEVIHEIRS